VHTGVYLKELLDLKKFGKNIGRRSRDFTDENDFVWRQYLNRVV
jgi:hypothetical protein